MEKVKSMCPGVLMIADMNLRLLAGEVAEVPSISKHMQSAIELGLLMRITEECASNEPKTEIKEDEPADLAGLSAAEAISRVNAEVNPEKLKGFLETEKRRSVLDALKSRLSEVSDDDK
jgi:hypothetical protein